jgi:DNA-binding MarR family transcriptional regulator
MAYPNLITDPTRWPLTERHHQFLRAVRHLSATTGLAPTLGELAAAMGISTGRAAQVRESLARRGLVVYERRGARTTRVIEPVPATVGKRRRERAAR